MIGQTIGPYQVLAKLGEGGMGEVYRARDTRLGRDVAIKVLPRAFTSDPDRLARFEREARVLASLNHPNIATIYGVEEADGVRALVMELVEGDTLAERISRGPLPVAAAVAFARQIADALDAAHEKGIVHRDLKPANIKITRDGAVKVLDFGLAKALVQEPASATAADNAATMTIGDTREGVIVGTAAYMSPEQARGQAVDKRTDIWAFGCVLYEMVTGRRAFRGATASDIIAAILEREPEWTALPPTLPGNVAYLLRRCLTKELRARVRDIGDAMAELDAPAAIETAARPVKSKRAAVLIIGGLLVLGIVAIAVLSRRNLPEPPAQRIQFELTIHEVAGLVTGALPMPSPDGRLIAFIAGGSARPMVWVRPLEAVQARLLPGTEGASGTVVWSPDGRWIGFFADGTLKKVAPEGGPAQTIAKVRGFQDAAWSAAGEIIFRPFNRTSIFGVPASGGAVREITTLDTSRRENSHRFLQFLPDGRRFLFTARSANRENNALFAGSLDSPGVTRIMPAQSRVTYLPGASNTEGTLLFYKDGALMAQPIDLASMSLQGEPAPVYDGVSYAAASIVAGFTASEDGRTIIIERAGSTDTVLTWFNRDGTEMGTLGPPGDYLQARLSPRGDRVVFTKPDGQDGNRDLWYTDIARGISARITSGGGNDWFPVWSPDGAALVFNSDRDDGSERPFLKKTLDIATAEALIPGGIGAPWDLSRDGQWLLTNAACQMFAQRIGSGGGKPFPFLPTPFCTLGGRFSPDGRWVAYMSNETGRPEVYVRPFTGAPAGEGDKIQISSDGGDYPVWDSKGELYFMGEDSNIYAASASTLGRTDAPIMPTRLFRACPNSIPILPPATMQSFASAFDTHDGQKFIVNCRVQPPGRYVVLLNALAPTP